MNPPLSYAGVIALCGDPSPYIREDGTVSPLWEMRMSPVPMPEPLQLGWDERKAKSARVNVNVVEETKRVFDILAKEKLWARFRTYDGGYEWRRQRGSSSRLSMHSFGLALDFDAATNKQGAAGDMDPGIVQVFEACGWTWGGRFQGSRIDPMHFQFAKGV